MTHGIPNREQGGSAIGAGLEAGLVGLLIGVGLPLLSWAIDFSDILSVLTMVCSIGLMPAVGALAAFWMRERGALTRGRLASAGAVAGALAGLAGSISFIVFNIMLDSATSDFLLSAGYSSGGLAAMSACIFGLPAILVGAGLGAIASVVTGSVLGIEPAVGAKEQPAPVGRPQQVSRTRPDPSTAPPDIRPAVQALEAGDNARARKALVKKLQDNPRDDAAWVWLSQAVEEPDKARECLRRALSINPNNATAKSMLAELDRPAQTAAGSPASAPADEKEERYLSWAAKRFGRRFLTRLLIFGAVMVVVFICSLLSQLLG
ncbi:MAG: tetratricopeptide repeat protein [Anaerolineales bacterium]